MLIKQFDAFVSTLTEKNNLLAEKDHTITDLQAQLAYLKRMLFGRKSEKVRRYDPNMPTLFDEEFKQQNDEAEAAAEEATKVVERVVKVSKKQARNERAWIEKLPILETEVRNPVGYDLTKRRIIGAIEYYELVLIPGKLGLKKTINNKWGWTSNTELPPNGEPGVIVAEAPLRPIEKCIAGPSLLGEMIYQKYELHTPYYRLIKSFSHLGLFGLKESTMTGWNKRILDDLLKPLYKTLKTEVMKSDYIQSDETTLPVIDKAKHKAAKEYLWVVRSVMEKLAFFHYDDGSRAGSVIHDLVKKYDFKGYVQCDGFQGYDSAFKARPSVTIVNCMAHIRRYFENAKDENPEVANNILEKFQSLYKLESDCDEANCSYKERATKRKKFAKPILDSIKVWCETEGYKYSEKSLVGRAVTYTVGHISNMEPYLKDGRLKIDNNLAENEIRPVAVGRKNYLFCGNHEAAENTAVAYSLLATCHNHNVNPRDYLVDIIAKMPAYRNATHEELVELLPHRWKLTHPESVIPESRKKVKRHTTIKKQ